MGTTRRLAIILAAFMVCANGEKPFYASSSRYPAVLPQNVPSSTTESATYTGDACSGERDAGAALDDGNEPAAGTNGWNVSRERPYAETGDLDDADTRYQRQREIQAEIDRLTEMLRHLKRNDVRKQQQQQQQPKQQQQGRQNFPIPLQRGTLKPIVVANRT